MTDEQLDKFFRDAAQRYTPPSAPEGAWEAFLERKKELELKGDSDGTGPVEDNKKSRKIIWMISLKRWPLKIAGILIFCLGCVGIWYALKESKADRKQDNGIAVAEKIAQPKLPSAEDSHPDIQLKMIHPRESAGQKKEKTSIDQAIILYALAPVQRSIALVGINSIAQKEAALNIQFGLKGLLEKQVVSDSDASSSQKDSIYNALTKADFLAANDATSDQGSQHDKSFQDLNRRAARGEDKTERKGHGKWQLGLIVGPNLTTVNGTVGKTAGLNTGVAVQRRISDSKFSLASGIVRESLVYNVSPEDFHPGGKNLNIPSLTSVKGKCQMLDVPINVRYDVVRSRKSNAFVSTGVSGLLMAKETYAYVYNKAGQTSQRTIDVTGKGKSLYTVTNLSIGYEHTFNRTSIQIEPYIKLPMSNIGYGNLNLGSLGTQISIKHNF